MVSQKRKLHQLVEQAVAQLENTVEDMSGMESNISEIMT